MLPTFHVCRRCNRRLKVSGELVIEGETAAVFQCDECLTNFTMDGHSFEAALTFAVDARGRVLDVPAESK